MLQDKIPKHNKRQYRRKRRYENHPTAKMVLGRVDNSTIIRDGRWTKRTETIRSRVRLKSRKMAKLFFFC